jgi:hypothetical protein
MSTPANQSPESFQFCEGYASYDPVGIVSLSQAVKLITTAISFALEHGITRLLVDATRLTGFPSPSVAERYWIVHEWAAEGKNVLEVALALQRHLMDPDRFGIQVAINLGMRVDVFEARADALAWLLSGALPQLPPHRATEGESR